MDEGNLSKVSNGLGAHWPAGPAQAQARVARSQALPALGLADRRAGLPFFLRWAGRPAARLGLLGQPVEPALVAPFFIQFFKKYINYTQIRSSQDFNPQPPH